MLNIEILMIELEDEAKMWPPPDRLRNIRRVLEDFDPSALVELANAPEEIQIRLKELADDKEEIWEWIHEEATLHNVTI